MRKQLIVLLLGMLCLTACGKEPVQMGTQSIKDIEESEESVSEPEETGEHTLSDEAVQGVIETGFYTLSVPDEWSGHYRCTLTGDNTSSSMLTFYNTETEAVQGEGSGFVCEVSISREIPWGVYYLDGDFLGQLTNKENGDVFYASILYPTDVQYTPESEDAYMALYESRKSLADNIVFSDVYELNACDFKDIVADVEDNVNGVTLRIEDDKTIVQLAGSGEIVEFENADDLDTSELQADLAVGHPYTFYYRGLMDEGGKLFRILDGDGFSSIEDYELSTVCSDIIYAFYTKDLELLASHCRFPLQVGFNITVSGAEEMKAMDFDTLFPQDVAEAMMRSDLSAIYVNNNGACYLQMYDGSPFIHLEKIEGTWQIIEIDNAYG